MTTGAGNDIERATELARRMVCEYGMSKMGPMTYGKKEGGEIFLGREIQQHRDFSDDTAEQIDAEVKKFVHDGYNSAYQILDANHDIMHRMSQLLLEARDPGCGRNPPHHRGQGTAAGQVAAGTRPSLAIRIPRRC